MREHRALQLDLRVAIERDELKLYFQPEARVKGDVVAFEALARWHHPIRGSILPSIFIPLAEESGLIIAIGEWVLREACREAASWSKPSASVSISLRCSSVTAIFPRWSIRSCRNRASPSRLELEVTEGVLIDDFARTVSILRRLKALGVRIAMDDFGTGYSSLSYLQVFHSTRSRSISASSLI